MTTNKTDQPDAEELSDETLDDIVGAGSAFTVGEKAFEATRESADRKQMLEWYKQMQELG